MSALYDRRFWVTYLAHALLYTAHVLTFRLADFVGLFGGSVRDAGYLVSAGLAGALVTRLCLGHLCDRHRLRVVWLGATILFVAGNALFLCQSELAPLLYMGRIVAAIGYAGMLVVTYAFVQARAPIDRRTEAVAMLGKAMFVGVIAGTCFGDAIIAELGVSLASFRLVYGAIVLCGLGYGTLIFFVARGVYLPRDLAVRSPLRRIKRWPLASLTVAMALGAHFAVTSFFLVAFLRSRGLLLLGPYFTIYAVASFVLRLSLRQWLNRTSSSLVIVVGCACLVASHASILLVQSLWMIVPPALLSALARTLIEPTLITRSADAFGPTERGSATALILAATDGGLMLAAPLFGLLMDHASYEAPFVACATLALAAAAVECGAHLRASRIRRRPADQPSRAAPIQASG